MPRKLRTFATSLGFYDLAVAAPSMKAALEAWGVSRDLFHQGFAHETVDPRIVAAAMARPGTVLRRPVGSNGPFTENTELPNSLPAKLPRAVPADVRHKGKKPKTGTRPAKVVDLASERAARTAAADYDREHKRQEREHARDEAARGRERARRERAVARAQGALDRARERHEESVAALDSERDALDRRSEAEERRWDAERKKLEGALRKARD
ncbi:MAG: cell envelope biogenesis protein TolA [Rhizomicrobium sp.]